MSQEHDQTKPNELHVDDAIHPEAAPFEPSYQPETLPQISVPDLPDDAQGLSAEALAKVPTLTELVDEPADVAQAEPAQAAEPEAMAPVEVENTANAALQPAEVIQEAPSQADTWGEELQVRMGKLNGDIQTLNARLDRLEERNKTKV